MIKATNSAAITLMAVSMAIKVKTILLLCSAPEITSQTKKPEIPYPTTRDAHVRRGALSLTQRWTKK